MTEPFAQHIKTLLFSLGKIEKKKAFIWRLCKLEANFLFSEVSLFKAKISDRHSSVLFIVCKNNWIKVVIKSKQLWNKLLSFFPPNSL